MCVFISAKGVIVLCAKVVKFSNLGDDKCLFSLFVPSFHEKAKNSDKENVG